MPMNFAFEDRHFSGQIKKKAEFAPLLDGICAWLRTRFALQFAPVPYNRFEYADLIYFYPDTFEQILRTNHAQASFTLGLKPSAKLLRVGFKVERYDADDKRRSSSKDLDWSWDRLHLAIRETDTRNAVIALLGDGFIIAHRV